MPQIRNPYRIIINKVQTLGDFRRPPSLPGEDPEQEVSLLASVEGAWHEAVASRRQQDSLAHLAEVDERLDPVDLEQIGESLLNEFDRKRSRLF